MILSVNKSKDTCSIFNTNSLCLCKNEANDIINKKISTILKTVSCKVEVNGLYNNA